jgi:hypothetical protein
MQRVHCAISETTHELFSNTIEYTNPLPTHVWVTGFARDTVSQSYGGHSGGETPGPIPNPEAKPSSADGTALDRVWESRTPPNTILTMKGTHTVGPLLSFHHFHTGCNVSSYDMSAWMKTLQLTIERNRCAGRQQRPPLFPW